MIVVDLPCERPDIGFVWRGGLAIQEQQATCSVQVLSSSIIYLWKDPMATSRGGISHNDTDTDTDRRPVRSQGTCASDFRIHMRMVNDKNTSHARLHVRWGILPCGLQSKLFLILDSNGWTCKLPGQSQHERRAIRGCKDPRPVHTDRA